MNGLPLLVVCSRGVDMSGMTRSPYAPGRTLLKRGQELFILQEAVVRHTVGRSGGREICQISRVIPR